MVQHKSVESLKSPLVWVVSLLAVSCIQGCGKDSDTDPGATSAESASEVVGASISGAVNGSASSGTLSWNTPRVEPQNWFARMFPLRVQQAWASNPACPTLASPPACSGSVLTLPYANCSFGSSPAVWYGSQILTWTAGTCGTAASGAIFTRTFGAGTRRTGALGVIVSMDTIRPSGYSVTNAGGGTTVNWTSASTRTITINGIHYTATKSYKTSQGVEKSVTVWDHTVSSNSPLTFTTGGGGGTIAAANNVIVLQHNLAKYTGSTSVITPLTFSAGCCHPTAGEIDTVLSGSLTGTEKLVYTSTCGSATYTSAAAGATGQTISLGQCL